MRMPCRERCLAQERRVDRRFFDASLRAVAARGVVADFALEPALEVAGRPPVWNLPTDA
jgi:hypothetical protein